MICKFMCVALIARVINPLCLLPDNAWAKAELEANQCQHKYEYVEKQFPTDKCPAYPEKSEKCAGWGYVIPGSPLGEPGYRFISRDAMWERYLGK